MGADSSNNALWLYPSTNEAFIIESIVAATLIFVAGAGFFILYMATKEAVNYPYAVKLLILGTALIAIGYGLLQYMLSVKSGTYDSS